jgi:putative endopeptidase
MVAVTAGCGTRPPQPAPPVADEPAAAPATADAAPPPPPPMSAAAAGIESAALDPATDPCADFYRHACGGWMEEASLGEAIWSRLAAVDDDDRGVVRALLTEAAATADDPLGIFWSACTAAPAGVDREAAAALLAAIDRVDDDASLAAALGLLHRHRIWALASLSVAPAFDRPDEQVLFFDPRGFGLSDRARYLATKYEPERAAYRTRMTAALQATGLSARESRRAADHAFAVETELARFAKPVTARADLVDAWHPLDRKGLASRAPHLSWAAYFEALGADAPARLSVTDPALLARIDRMIDRLSPARWRGYLRWQVARSLQVPEGKPEPRCVDTAIDELDAIVGLRFAQKVLPEAERARALELVEAMRAGLGAHIAAGEGLSDEGRAAVAAKLDGLIALVGWGGEAPAAPALGEAHTANVLALRAARTAADLDRLGAPRDRERWPVTAASVDTFYDPLDNRIVLPAGVLRPPIFRASGIDAASLGALALVAGHHLVHAVHGIGTRFDASGAARDWLPVPDLAALAERTECLVERYAAFEPVPGAHVDGVRTRDENAADLLGAQAAYAAFQSRRAGAEPLAIAGHSEAQVFFIAMAQSFCSRHSEGALRRLLATHAHAPPDVRINAAVSAMPEFAEAFSCPAGAAMRREPVCRIY